MCPGACLCHVFPRCLTALGLAMGGVVKGCVQALPRNRGLPVGIWPPFAAQGLAVLADLTVGCSSIPKPQCGLQSLGVVWEWGRGWAEGLLEPSGHDTVRSRKAEPRLPITTLPGPDATGCLSWPRPPQGLWHDPLRRLMSEPRPHRPLWLGSQAPLRDLPGPLPPPGLPPQHLGPHPVPGWWAGGPA